MCKVIDFNENNFSKLKIKMEIKQKFFNVLNINFIKELKQFNRN